MIRAMQQPHPFACGPTALAMIADHYNLLVDTHINALSVLALQTQKGVSMAALSIVADRIGFETLAVRATNDGLPTVQLPAIVHLNIGTQQHWSVLVRVSKHCVILADPATGQSGVITRDIFDQLWDGVMLLLVPKNSGLLFTRSVLSVIKETTVVVGAGIEMSEAEQIARTILEQLGGNKFRVMTGAKNFSFGTSDLTFKLPIGNAAACRIELTSMDDYTVTFFKREQLRTIVKNGGPTILSKHDGVYVESLRELFERVTGLRGGSRCTEEDKPERQIWTHSCSQ